MDAERRVAARRVSGGGAHRTDSWHALLQRGVEITDANAAFFDAAAWLRRLHRWYSGSAAAARARPRRAVSERGRGPQPGPEPPKSTVSAAPIRTSRMTPSFARNLDEWLRMLRRLAIVVLVAASGRRPRAAERR